MVDYDIVEAQPWHCGAMSRMLRHEHQKVLATIGLRTHHELRGAFDESSFRRACLVDGKLVALWGVTGPLASAFGLVWLAFSNAILKKYPLTIIKEARSQIADMLLTKRKLFCTILEGDEAAARFAIFLGFVPEVDGVHNHLPPAETRYGRKQVADQLRETEWLRLCSGGRVHLMAYGQMEAA